MKTFVIHYTPLKERKRNIEILIKSLNLDSEFITEFDRDSLSSGDERYKQSFISWNNQLSIIKKVLIKNILNNKNNNSLKCKIFWHFVNLSNGLFLPNTFKFRKLSLSEISLTLKHYSALRKIEKLKAPALIIEDDILERESSKILIEDSYKYCKQKFDYIDLGGGCNLPLLKNEKPILENNNFIDLKIPRSRTTAAYMITPKAAQKLANGIFPITMPLDWQYQYLFIKNKMRIGWSYPSAFFHGSEKIYKSSIRD